MTQLINLTSDIVTLHGLDGGPLDVLPHGTVARLQITHRPCRPVDGIPVVRAISEAVDGLPGPHPGVVYIVSAEVAAHPTVAGRPDVFSPGEAVLDAYDRVIGYRCLQAV